MVLASTGPMVGFYTLVVFSVSLTLSKAIRDSERAAPVQLSRQSSCNDVSTAAATIKLMASAGVARLRGAAGGNSGDGAGAGGRAVANRGKAAEGGGGGGGGYKKTKRVLRRLTVVSIAILMAVLMAVVGSLREGTIANVSDSSSCYWYTSVIIYICMCHYLPHVPSGSA